MPLWFITTKSSFRSSNPDTEHVGIIWGGFGRMEVEKLGEWDMSGLRNWKSDLRSDFRELERDETILFSKNWCEQWIWILGFLDEGVQIGSAGWSFK